MIAARHLERSATHLGLLIAILAGWSTACALPAVQPGASHPGEQAAYLNKDQALAIAREVERRGDDLRTEQYLRLAIDRGASQEQILPRLLATYVRGRKYRLAAQCAENYLRRHPQEQALQLLLANLYEALGDLSRAITQYRHILRQSPNNPGAHLALAVALSGEGHHPVAADHHFRRYLELEPEGAFADQARGALLTEVPR